MERLENTTPLACGSNLWQSSETPPRRQAIWKIRHTTFLRRLTLCYSVDTGTKVVPPGPILYTRLWNLCQIHFSPQGQQLILQATFHVPPHLPCRRACDTGFRNTSPTALCDNILMWYGRKSIEWSGRQYVPKSAMTRRFPATLSAHLPRALAAHHRLDRKSPWPALSSSLLHGCRDINTEKVVSTCSVPRPMLLEIFMHTLYYCTVLQCSSASCPQSLWRHSNLIWVACVLCNNGQAELASDSNICLPTGP